MKRTVAIAAAIAAAWIAGGDRAAAADWTYTIAADGNTGVISDGDWELNVKINPGTADELYLVSTATVGEGCLDLAKPITSLPGTASARSWHIVHVPYTAFKAKAYPHAVVMPTLMESSGGYLFQNNTALTNLVFRSATLKETKTADFQVAGLRKADVRLPNLKTLGANAFYGASLVETDIGDWNLDAVQAVGNYALTSSKINGVVRFPSVRTVGECAFQSTANIRGFLLGDFVSAGSTAFASTGADFVAFRSTARFSAFNATSFQSAKTTRWFFDCPYFDQTAVGGLIPAAASDYAHCYYFIKGDARWSDFVKTYARELTAEETAVFREKFGTSAEPFGVFPKVSGGTACAPFYQTKLQFLAYGTPESEALDDIVQRAVPEGVGAAETVPAGYGTLRDVTGGETLSVPATAVHDGRRFAVEGWTLEKRTCDGGWSVEKEGSGNVYTHVAGTPGTRRLTWRWKHAGWCAVRYGASVRAPYPETVTVSPAPDADGGYAVGTELTFTVSGLTEAGEFASRVVRWEGAAGTAGADNRTFTCTVGEAPMNVTAVIARDWSLFETNLAETAEAEPVAYSCISDGNWILTVKRKTDGTLALLSRTSGNQETTGLPRCRLAGEGDLDLTGAIRERGGADEPVALSEVGSYAFCSPADDDAAKLTSVILPPSCSVIGDYVFLRQTGLARVVIPDDALKRIGYFAFARCTGLGELVLRQKDLAHIYNQAAANCTGLTNVVLRLPAMTSLPNMLYDVPAVSDVSTWDLSSVKTLNATFNGCKGLYGVLELPSVTSIAANTFSRVASLNGIHFSGNQPVETVADGAFTNASGIDTLIFDGPAPTRENLDRMLVGVAAPGVNDDKRVKMFASRHQAGWLELADTDRTGWSVRETSEEEAMRIAGLKPIGVYVCADGARKAWIVQRKSPYDPRGFSVIVR